MSTEANKAVVRHFVEKLKSGMNLEAIDDDFAADAVFHWSDPQMPPNAEGLRMLAHSFFAGFSDIQTQVEVILAEGDLVADRETITARHTGEFMGMAATGKTVHWAENHIYRVRDGKIVEWWAEVDLLEMMQQLRP
jgi:predicted ester cyclase